MEYQWTVTTPAAPPNDIPVTVALARQQCRIPDESFDDMLDLMIRAAARYVENAARLILCPQTIRVTWPAFPYGNPYLRLPFGPVRGAVTLEYVAGPTGGDPTVFTALTGFQTFTDGNPPRLAPAVNSFWPISMIQAVPGVRATYAVGFASAAAIPAALRNAILMIVRANYEMPDGIHLRRDLVIPPIIEQFIATESLRGYP